MDRIQPPSAFAEQLIVIHGHDALGIGRAGDFRVVSLYRLPWRGSRIDRPGHLRVFDVCRDGEAQEVAAHLFWNGQRDSMEFLDMVAPRHHMRRMRPSDDSKKLSGRIG